MMPEPIRGLPPLAYAGVDGMMAGTASEYRMGLRDYFAALIRHKYALIFTTALILAIGCVVAVMWPPSYRSTATILIEEQEIPPDLVRTTITSYADQRIQVISQHVMTRARLTQIIDKFDLYPKERRTQATEDILERMRKDIKVDLVNTDVTDRRTGGRTSATIAFTLSYDSESAEKAQRVANELTTLYLNENLQIRKQKADEASAFLAREADELSERLNEIEKNLSEFKQKNQGRTPELAQVNLSMRDRTDTEIMDTERAISSMEERRFYIESQLAQLKPNVAVSVSGDRVLDPAERLQALRAQYTSMQGAYSPDHPDMKRVRRQIRSLEREAGVAADGSEEARQLQRLQDELATLRNRYADDHPDIVRLKGAIAALETIVKAGGNEQAKKLALLKTNLASLRERMGGDHPEVSKLAEVIRGLEKPVAQAAKSKDKVTYEPPKNPTYIALKTQLEAIDIETKSLKKHRDELRARMATLEARLEKTPEVERDFLELIRDRENTVVRYRQVKAKLMEAEVAQVLEQARKAERFSLIDPAQYPEKPRSPNRPAILLIAFVLSLGGGVGSVALLELLDSSVRGTKDLGRTLPTPVLGAVPYILNEADRRRAKRSFISVALGVMFGFVVVLIAIDVLWMPLDLFWYAMLRRVSAVFGVR